MSLPAPIPGLVIGYDYLWAREHARGAEDAAKARPCAIIAAQRLVQGSLIVTVLPITHSPPASPADAVEMPPALKRHLGLDELRSWIMVSETNDFLWPGPDLAPISSARPARFAYGMLPPRFFALLRDRVLERFDAKALRRVSRTS